MKTIARLPMAQLAADAGHVEALKALAHRSRLQVFFVLVKAAGEMSVGEIQEAVEIPGPTLSHHLDALQREGLVTVTRQGKFLRYRADAAGLKDLLAFLYTECCTRSSLVPVSALKGVRS